MVKSSLLARNLSRNDLGGVIFGCTRETMEECLVNLLFGLPGEHISYVKHIEPGLALFLFNYNERKLYGIFEADSCGQLDIDRYAWSSNGSEKTKYPAQVRVRSRFLCEPLLEQQFRPILANNYRTPSRFCFEVDHTQTAALISLFGSSPVIGGSAKWIPAIATNRHTPFQVQNFGPTVPEAHFNCSDQPNMNLGALSDTTFYKQNQCETHFDGKEVETEENRVYLKLKKLALERKDANNRQVDYEELTTVLHNTNSEHERAANVLSGIVEKNEETSTSESQSVILHQLKQEMKELKVFSQEQLQKANILEKKMAASMIEIKRLQDRVQLLECQFDTSRTYPSEALAEPFDLNYLSSDDLIFLIGGYDGYSWLSALDCYTPSKNVLRSLLPMDSPRSHAAAAVLNGHIYVFGGENGDMWYDSVASYNPESNRWTSCPPLSVEKSNLAGASLYGKLFAIGGGNAEQCFSDVEMFDPSLGRWINSQSMLLKRYAPASAVLNGAIYAVGGYDGENYLKSAERFDPREISWEKVPSMNSRRGCHSLVSFNEKLYAIGGNDGTSTVSSVEVLDPRFGSWTSAESMNRSRGYAGAVVIGESIYIIGGVQEGPTIDDTVEYYNESRGWGLAESLTVGKRCFFSAVVL